MPPTRRRRQRRSNRRSNGIQQVTRAIRDLTTVTLDRSMPDRPDRQPMPSPRRNPVYTFTRSVSKGTVTATNAETITALTFSLSDLPSASDFTSLFDQYRLVQIILQFVPVTLAFGPSTTATDLPSVHTVIDYDDNTAPATLDTLRQFGTHQIVPNQSYFRRVLTPRCLNATYQGAFTAYALAPVAQFNDSNNPGVIYYGVKIGTSPVTTVSGVFILYNIEATYTIQCRSTI